MANIPIWPGSSSFHPGDTPFGFYDNDIEFQQDADKFAKFAAQRLGYPIVDIELQDLNFYADDFYYPFRNAVIKKLGKHLLKPDNLMYFLNKLE